MEYRKLSQDQVARLDRVSETKPIYPYWHQRQSPELMPNPVAPVSLLQNLL